MVGLYVAPVTVAGLSWAIAHFLSRHQPNRALWVLLVLDLAILAALMFRVRVSVVYDALGYFFFAMVFAAPIAIGLVLGLLTGLWVRRSRR